MFYFLIQCAEVWLNKINLVLSANKKQILAKKNTKNITTWIKHNKHSGNLLTKRSINKQLVKTIKNTRNTKEEYTTMNQQLNLKLLIDKL